MLKDGDGNTLRVGSADFSLDGGALTVSEDANRRMLTESGRSRSLATAAATVVATSMVLPKMTVHETAENTARRMLARYDAAAAAKRVLRRHLEAIEDEEMDLDVDEDHPDDHGMRRRLAAAADEAAKAASYEKITNLVTMECDAYLASKAQADKQG